MHGAHTETYTSLSTPHTQTLWSAVAGSSRLPVLTLKLLH
jgi:hypothetical protein